jgi:hypothetical protein
MENVKIFISWAGETSRQVGEALHGWIPLLWDSVDPWISGRDLNKGRQWQNEIITNLRSSRFGIVCLTPDNLSRPWMLFEAGAISTLSEESVFTFLHRVQFTQVTEPLSMFNHTASQEDDVMKMVTSLNDVLGAQKVHGPALNARFQKFWPDLKAKLEGIEIGQSVAEDAPHRDQEAIAAEILTLVRDISKSLPAASRIKAPLEPDDRRPVRSIASDRFFSRIRELGVRATSMSMPMETRGGITIELESRKVEVPIGDVADFVDGILKPIDLLELLGITKAAPDPTGVEGSRS